MSINHPASGKLTVNNDNLLSNNIPESSICNSQKVHILRIILKIFKIQKICLFEKNKFDRQFNNDYNNNKGKLIEI